MINPATPARPGEILQKINYCCEFSGSDATAVTAIYTRALSSISATTCTAVIAG
jgi:hypothetical protein